MQQLVRSGMVRQTGMCKQQQTFRSPLPDPDIAGQYTCLVLAKEVAATSAMAKA